MSEVCDWGVRPLRHGNVLDFDLLPLLLLLLPTNLKAQITEENRVSALLCHQGVMMMMKSASSNVMALTLLVLILIWLFLNWLPQSQCVSSSWRLWVWQNPHVSFYKGTSLLFICVYIFNTYLLQNWSILLCPLGKNWRERRVKTKHWIRENVIFWFDFKAQTCPQLCTDFSDNTAIMHFSSDLLYSPSQESETQKRNFTIHWNMKN